MKILVATNVATACLIGLVALAWMHIDAGRQTAVLVEECEKRTDILDSALTWVTNTKYEKQEALVKAIREARRRQP